MASGHFAKGLLKLTQWQMQNEHVLKGTSLMLSSYRTFSLATDTSPHPGLPSTYLSNQPRKQNICLEELYCTYLQNRLEICN